ncbi:THO complex subunit 5 [Globomyces sp. JEL0801]|nr:THO complex subunit 5 [Globomyces sp. JEL0801]
MSTLHHQNFKKLYDQLKDEATNLQNGTLSSSKATLLFLESTLAHTKHRKQLITEAKVNLDRLHLLLQNLHYQSQHLSKEILKCESHETIHYQNVHLCPIEDFLKSDCATEVDISDEYQLTLARLDHELKERERLLVVLSQLKTEKSSVSQIIKQKNQELEQLDKDLEDLIQYTLPLQEKLQMKSTSSRQQNEKARCLPGPLFTLYRHATGYSSESFGNFLKVKLPGNKITVDIIENKQNEAIKGPEGDEKDMDIDEPIDLYEKHPFSVVLSFYLDGRELIKLAFHFAIHLNIVVVQTTLKESFANVPVSFVSSQFYPGDDGHRSPNPENDFLNDGGFIFDPQAANGFAYHWAQSLCGLEYPMPYSLKLSPSKTWIQFQESESSIPFLSKIASSLMERRSLLIKINTTLAAKLAGKLSLPKPMSGKVFGKLLSFVKSESTLTSQQFKFKLDISGTTYTVMLSILASYPHEPCRFEIVSEKIPNQSDTLVEQNESINNIITKVEDTLDLKSTFQDYHEENLIEYQIVKLTFYLSKFNNSHSLSGQIIDVSAFKFE